MICQKPRYCHGQSGRSHEGHAEIVWQTRIFPAGEEKFDELAIKAGDFCYQVPINSVRRSWGSKEMVCLLRRSWRESLCSWRRCDWSSDVDTLALRTRSSDVEMSWVQCDLERYGGISEALQWGRAEGLEWEDVTTSKVEHDDDFMYECDEVEVECQSANEVWFRFVTVLYTGNWSGA